MTDKKETAGLRPAVFEAGENAQPHNRPNPLLSQALRYAERGWPVFPLKPRGKTPLTPNGFKDAATDKKQIVAWWEAHPDANIGLATGTASGLFVLDIDGDDGEQSLKKLEENHGPLPPTGEVITGGGGRHLYFKLPDVRTVRNSAGKLGLGLDVRGDGGYVVAPPSIHSSGKPYERSVDSHNQIAPPPDWLVDLVCGISDTKTQSGTRFHEGLEVISEGRRNSTLTTLCGLLLNKRVSPGCCLALCRAVNRQCCQPPLADHEVHQIVNSIAGRELARTKESNHDVR
ncbi:MAG: DNA primase [Micavibrio aeruginosavorus]|uniref:DNA primase n=1 Tax=Micavibrio aeruginosavorus TaxID=349221 RepID=A0A2W5BRP0_9BACT|nr:MAG: DNA primase [Micavibrio aeruginosavorus]